MRQNYSSIMTMKLAFGIFIFLNAHLTMGQNDPQVFDNGVSSGNANDCLASDAGAFQLIADEVQLNDVALVSEVHWSGNYSNSSNPPATDNFSIDIYADVGGNPVGSPLASFDVGNDVNRTGPFANNVFEFDAGISFVMEANTPYWISIHDQNSSGLNFCWSSLTGGGTYAASSNGGSTWSTQGNSGRMHLTLFGRSGLVLERSNTNDATFHVASNWDPAITPTGADTIVFNSSAPNYQVRFNNDTGNRSVNEVVVQDDDVEFANPFNSTRHKLTVGGNVVVAEQGVFSVLGIEVASDVGIVTGTLNVGGPFLPGSSFVTDGPLIIDNGALNISDGNTVSTADIITGGDAEISSSSTVLVEDNGSEWAIAGELQVSSSGSTVTVIDAATLRSNGATLQNSSVITIDGANSQWINTGGIFLNGPPRLDIDNGGLVDVAGSVTGGTILFGGSGGTLIAPAGVTGTTIGSDGTSEIQGSIIENSSTIFPSAGSTLTITGDVSNTLASLQDGLNPAGTIRIEGAYNGGAINVNASPGTVELAGDFNPANADSQQTGTVRFQGVSLQMESGTNTNIQIASASDFDLIEVFFDGNGAEPDLTLDGQLNVELLGGFQLANDQSFEIIDYDTFGVVSGAFANAAEGDVVLTSNGFELVVRYEFAEGGSTGRVILETQVTGAGDPPANDDWPNGTISTTFPINVTGTNVDATVQPGELQLVETGATVWWFFDAPADGTVTIDTFGSDYDTQLHIYDGFFSGATVADLNPITNDDDSNGTTQSEVTFAVTAGTCYEIRVGGFDFDSGGNGDTAAQGNIVLNGSFEPVGFLLGDVNCDGEVNLLDVQPFVNAISNGAFEPKADINQDGSVNLLDVGPFVSLLSGT